VADGGDGAGAEDAGEGRVDVVDVDDGFGEHGCGYGFAVVGTGSG
jgi:hypothetical protein